MMESTFVVKKTQPTQICTLSLHDALPISDASNPNAPVAATTKSTVLDMKDSDAGPEAYADAHAGHDHGAMVDRKSTRLNSSHGYISYAVFCLKKKIKTRLAVL